MVKIITHSCPECGTIVAGNVLERRRDLKCPNIECSNVLRFSDLPKSEQQHIENHREEYTLEE